MKGGIYSQIGAVREELPSSSRKVADYVLTHMNQIAQVGGQAVLGRQFC